MSDNRISPTGARRAGDDYQDAIAIEAMIDMLEQPEKFSVIEFEAEDAKKLDDVVRHSADGKCKELFQVKYSLYPEFDTDNYDWETLLNRKKNRQGKLLPSLLGKWISSYIYCKKESVIAACLKTNRNFSEEIKNIYDDTTKKINHSKIPSHILLTIKEEGFSSEEIKDFFDHFEFYVSYIELEALEVNSRRRLKKLGCNDDSYYRLSKELHKWIRNDRSKIDVSQIRTACQWYQLKHFDEKFLIAEDYVIPDKQFYEKINSLLKSTIKCVCIYGAPGLGKSSFISNLKQNWKDGYFVRHHYFLDMDRNTGDRIKTTDVLESLMSEMSYVCPDGIKTLQKNNPSPREFRKWFEECSSYCEGQNTKLIIAIDGLDHVHRSGGTTEELNNLLSHLFPIPDGATLLLGTQPLLGEKKPALLNFYASQILEQTLPSFNRTAIDEWIGKNKNIVGLRDERYNVNGEYNTLLDMLLNYSSGHPLMLRYILQEALNGMSMLSPYNLIKRIKESVKKVPKNLSEYYNILRGRCSSCAIFLIKCMAFSSWSWKHDKLIQLAIKNKYSREAAETGWSEIRHMFKSIDEEWQFIHESFLLHLRKEYEKEEKEFSDVIIDWLQNNGTSYLKWRYLAEFTNTLNNTNREWCIEALVNGYLIDDITMLIARDAAIDLQEARYRDCTTKALWYEYLGNRYNFYNKLDIENIWTETQLLLDDDGQILKLLLRNKTSISDEQLYGLLNYVKDKKDNKILLDELKDRLQNNRYNDHDYDSRHNSLQEIVFNVFGNIELNIDMWVDNFNKHKDIAVRCIKSLWANNNKDLICKYLSHPELNAKTKLLLSEYLVLLAQENGFNASLSDGFINNDFESISSGKSHHKCIPNAAIPEYDYPKGGFELNHWVLTVLLFISAQSSINKSTVDHFIDEVCASSSWFADICKKISNIFAKRDNFKNIIIALSDALCEIQRPHMDARPDFHIWQSLYSCCPEFVIKLKILMPSNKSDIQFSVDEINTILETNFCSAEQFLDQLLTYRRDQYLSSAGKDLLAEKILNIPCDRERECNKNTALVALMWARGQEYQRAQSTLRHSFDLFFTYGWHKDALFYNYICAGKLLKSEDIKELFVSLIDASYFIGGYTDDGNFIEYMSSFLADKWPEALMYLYDLLTNNYAYRDAEYVFNKLCMSFELSSNVEKALVRSNLSSDFLDTISSEDKCKKYSFMLDDPNYIYVKGNPKNNYKNSTDYFDKKVKIGINVANFSPNKFNEFLNVSGGSLISREELTLWCEYWAAQHSAQFVLDILKNYILSNDYFNSEIKLKVFEYILQLDGKIEAWSWLIDYYLSISGWASNWTDLAKAEEVWDIIKEQYPQKIFDFIFDTMTKESKFTFLNMWGCAERLSKYFIFFGRYDLAMEIMRGNRDALEQLMSPLGVPINNIQVATISDDSLIDLLLKRLEWPSCLVREQACKELAMLLKTSNADLVLEKIKCFVENHDLDSIAQIGLLSLIFYKEINGLLPTNFSIDRRKPCSIALTYLLNDLFPEKFFMPSNFERAPTNYVYDEKFDDLRRKLLPGMYNFNAKEINDKFNEFLTQWAYEFYKLSYIEVPNYIAFDYYGDARGEHLAIMATLPSEKMRSAYLNALTWLAQSSGNIDLMEYLSLQSIPIKPDLWTMINRNSPDIFKIDEKSEDLGIDAIATVVSDKIEKKVASSKKNSNLIAYASGRVQTTKGIYELELRGFLQKSTENRTPDSEQLFKAIDKAKTARMDIDQFHVNNGIVNVNNPYDPIHLVDWEIFPLFAILPIFNYWQFWRGHRDIAVPNIMTKSYSMKTDTHGIDFWNCSVKVGHYTDWVIGISERIEANLLPNSGNIMTISKDVISQFLSDNYNYCIAYKLTLLTSQTGIYSGFAEDNHFGYLGHLPIIVP